MGFGAFYACGCGDNVESSKAGKRWGVKAKGGGAFGRAETVQLGVGGSCNNPMHLL